MFVTSIVPLPVTWNYAVLFVDKQNWFRIGACRCQSLTVWALHGEVGRGGDVAHVVPVAGHPDVATCAPSLAPRVLHDPVVGPLRAVADDQYSVASFLLGARSVREYTCTGKGGDSHEIHYVVINMDVLHSRKPKSIAFTRHIQTDKIKLVYFAKIWEAF